MKGDPIEIRQTAVYTLAEVCQILRISDATGRRWIKDGKVPAARVGRAYRFLGQTLIDVLAGRSAPSDRVVALRGQRGRS